MSYVDTILDRAFKSALSQIWADARPKNKFKRRIRNRNKLYKNQLHLGRTKRIKKGGK